MLDKRELHLSICAHYSGGPAEGRSRGHTCLTRVSSGQQRGNECLNSDPSCPELWLDPPLSMPRDTPPRCGPRPHARDPRTPRLKVKHAPG